MSLVVQEIPKVGLVMEAVKVVRWLKQVGDLIKIGEPLVEVETEKSVVEIEATVGGRLAEILIPVDQEATVGDRLALIESDQSTETTPPSVAAVTPAAIPAATPAPTSAARVTPAAAPAAANGDRILVSPIARKLATEQGIDLAVLTGSGPRGRIELEDVKQHIEAGATGIAAGGGSLTPMRRALARSMTLSNATVPQFTMERRIDWSTVLERRRAFQATLPSDAPKLSVNDFLLQAVARSLIAYPALNATFAGEPDSPNARIVPAAGAHVGLVLAVENGIVVPVFHDLETLGLVDIATRRLSCVERGLRGVLKREELDGATFSISNLGANGPDRFSAIINPPQSAILAVGRLRDDVVVVNGQVVVRPISDLTISIDHRVADGRLASDFLTHLVSVL